MALWNQIPPEKPIFLRAYLLKIVRNIAYDRLDQRQAAKRSDAVTVCLHELEDCLPAGDDLDAILESKLIRQILNDYLYSLKERDRSLFIRRYFLMENCRTIGKDPGMTQSAVSTRLARLRHMLKQKLTEEGIAL
jgi:RNA polymerase sigma-70 factor (ECF subfamily)